MESKAIVVYAEKKPMMGITNPGPHQLYRQPRVYAEKRTLGNLHSDEIRVEMLYRA